MKIDTHYDQWADRYDLDENRTRDMNHRVVKQILGNTHYENIIEIGCGTGKNTRFFSQMSKHVIAMDFSQGMLEKARTNIPYKNVTFSLADSTKKWPCEDKSMDLVTCNLILEHIEDLSTIFLEAYRVLNQRGVLFISELHPYRQYQGGNPNYELKGKKIEIPSFIHPISEYFDIGKDCGFALLRLNEWWDENNRAKPPRMVSFLFEKKLS